MHKKEKNKSLAVVIGTRPEGIKLCPLVLTMRAHGLDVTVISSGQHQEMLAEVFSCFGIEPDISLPQLCFGEDLPSLLAHLIVSLREALVRTSPAAVIVQGDTATAYAAALTAFLLRIPVIHIEAGLRSGDPFSPFPEESFRKGISAMASVHIAPSAQAMLHLWREGVSKKRVFLLGNTVEDAVRYLLPVRPPESKTLLLTLHRREHSEVVMRGIFSAVKALMSRLPPDYSIVYPVHPSPRVRRVAEEMLGGVERVRLLPPLSPIRFYPLLAAAPLVLTDSGGVQEEAAILGVKALVLRESTERESELQAGRIHLGGTEPLRIVSMAEALLQSEKQKKESRNGSPCERICEVLIKECGFDMPPLCREF